jgi:protein TonB
VLEEIKADYPADAHRMGIEGVVDLKVTIGPKGEVLDVKVLKAAGHGFDEAARAALKKFKFSPPRTSDGKGVVTNIPYKYRFELPPQ